MEAKYGIVTALISFIFILSRLISPTSGQCFYINHEDKDWTEIYKNQRCRQDDICRKTFNVSFINLLPFSSSPGIFTQALHACCGNCTKYRKVNEYRNITELTDEVFKESDIILPFLGSPNQVELFGYHFIPFFEVTDAFYITERKGSPLFYSILQLYPLVIICVLLAVISGFVEWLLETSSNEAEFSRGFLIGWFEGIWWSFVTMTTVGYGDKTPKSFIGRLFAIIWILIGLVTWGILTASLTTGIINANSPPPPDLTDMIVGSLKYRDYEQLIIADEGGIRVNADGWDFYSEMLLLIDKLQKKEIEGILMERFTSLYSTWILPSLYSSPNDFFNYSSYPMTPDFVKAKVDYFLNETMRTELHFRTERLAYGLLMKSREDYEYFIPFFRDNYLRNKIGDLSEFRRRMRQERKAVKGSYYSNSVNMLFSPTESYFQNFLKVIALILILISVFGLLYEYKKRRSNMSSKMKDNDNGGKAEEDELFAEQGTTKSTRNQMLF